MLNYFERVLARHRVYKEIGLEAFLLHEDCQLDNFCKSRYLPTLLKKEVTS